MSLHHAAQHLAAQGRHGDSMLVHMTPHEVSGLQTLLQNHGRTLTINPHTGLPEAWLGNDIVNAVSDAFSSVGHAVQDITSSPIGSLLVGAALMAAGVPGMVFGPGALAGAGGAALLTGGASLASGNSFKQSAMSGLGAYGGASMAGSMGLGEAAAGAGPGGASAAPTLPGGTPAPVATAPISAPVEAAGASTGATIAGNADKAALLGNAGYGAGVTGAETSAFDAGMQAASGAVPSTAASTTPSMWDKVVGYGDKATAAMSEHPYRTAGGAYALGAMTGGPKQTVNPDGSINYEGAYIRPYVYDPATGGLHALGPVKAPIKSAADGGIMHLAQGGYDLGGYSDGGRLLKGPGDGVSDSIPATIGDKQPARLADGEFVVPARIVSELGNGSTDAGARQLYKMMDRIQSDRKHTVGKNKVATNTSAAKHLPA